MPEQVSPQVALKKIGESHEIVCNTVTSAIWWHNSKLIQSVYYDKIVIENISVLKKGKYTCEGSDKNGILFYSESVLKVIGEFKKSV